MWREAPRQSVKRQQRTRTRERERKLHVSDYRETLREILCETFLCVCVCTGTQEGEVCVYVCVWKEEKRSGCVLFGTRVSGRAGEV